MKEATAPGKAWRMWIRHPVRAWRIWRLKRLMAALRGSEEGGA